MMGESGVTNTSAGPPQPVAEECRDLTLISDLHLGPGSGSGPGGLGYRETFFRDAPFCRFLEHLGRESAGSGRSWRLVILGDFLDFLRAGLHGPEETTAECQARAMAALDRIASGHPLVLDGLGRWLAEGNPIELVLGNHDRELIFPAVQDRLARP